MSLLEGLEGFAEFLLARIAEDKEAALAATPGRWRQHPADGEYVIGAVGGEDSYVDVADTCNYLSDRGLRDAAHIARWDPARVLVECEVKRQLVEREAKQVEHVLDGPGLPPRKMPGTWTLRVLGLAYADRPGYRPEWRP